MERLYAAAAKSLQSCLTLCDPIDSSPPGSPVPGILQAKTGVGCHFLLQCMKVKSESEVSQSHLTLRDPMDYSLPGSSVQGIFQARVLEQVATSTYRIPFSWEQAEFFISTLHLHRILVTFSVIFFRVIMALSNPETLKRGSKLSPNFVFLIQRTGCQPRNSRGK